MVRLLKIIANAPWSLLGVLNAPVCIPVAINLAGNAVIFKTLWIGPTYLYAPNAKGITTGNIVVVKHYESQSITEHELIHVAQAMRCPFFMQFVYLYQVIHYGYWNSPYEIEAYSKAIPGHHI